MEARDKRSHAVFRFLSVALQHQDAIVILISTRSNDSSALALLRCLHDTCIRGVWVAACADEPHIQTVLEQEFDFQAVNPAKGISDKFGASVSKDTREMLHSLTHTGFEQIGAQYSDQHQIEPAFDIEKLLYAIRSASAELALLTFHACHVAGRKDLGSEAWRMFRNFFPES